MASSFLRFIITFLSLLPSFALAQSSGNISVGASLLAGDNETSPWLSPSNHFAFGFYRLEANDLFLVAIWFYNVPNDNIVWYANGNSPVPRGSKLQLTASAGLVLSSPAGEQKWRSEFNVGAAAYGFMNDTGNFVLVNGNDQVLWQSFEDPTDTLLPNQIMEVNGKLSSRKSEKNFSTGGFQFRMLRDGNAVLNPINIPSNFTYAAYYVSDTSDAGNESNSGYQVRFDESGNFYILRRSGEQKLLSPDDKVSSTDYYYRATLHYDGVFTISYYPKNPDTANGKWTVITTLPGNICVDNRGDLGSAPCGYNSICTLKSDGRPTCKCPPGYSLLDSMDEYGTCKADFPQGCSPDDVQNSQEDEYSLEELGNTDWPTSDYEQRQPSSLEDCQNSCLQDCLCAAAVIRGDSCWKKKLPLSNGREDKAVNGIAFLKVRKGDSTSKKPPISYPGATENQSSLTIVLSVLLGSSVFFNFIFAGFLCSGFFFFYNKKIKSNRNAENSIGGNLRHFTYKELEEATNGFKEEIGRGSFGIVYKGLVETGYRVATAIAVKKLDRVVQDTEKEFKNEVDAIGQTHHKNLVRLLGYCDDGQYRLLVYEFMSNGTLSAFLFGELKPSWSQRTQIALGIARGLLYLHEECSTQVIHCDIKPQNILLDDYYNARISDFGLAKLLMINQSYTNTCIRGTKGYVAPEWFRTTPVTVKVDVYSFGVLLLEIICCRRSINVKCGEGEGEILMEWAFDCYQEGILDTLVGDDAEAINDMRKLERFLMVAFWCIQEELSLRPTMKKVLLMLEGIVQVPIPPCPWSFGSSIA